MIIIGIITLIIIFLLFVYSLCKISSKCSSIEEELNQIRTDDRGDIDE